MTSQDAVTIPGGPDLRLTSLQPGHFPQLAALRRLEYGPTEFGTMAYIQWQALANPAGPPAALLAVDSQGQPVGEHWAVPTWFVCGFERHLGAVGANALVHPSYRRRGVFVALNQGCAAKCRRRGLEFTLYVPNHRSSQALQRRGGVLNLGEALFLLYPLDIPKILKAWGYFRGWRLGEWVAPVLNRRMRQRYICQREISIKVERGACFAAEYDRLWDKLQGGYRCMTARTSEYMNWRYSSASGRHYQVMTAHWGSEPVGYLIFRLATILGIGAGFIIDLLTEPGEHGRIAGMALIEAALTRARDGGAHLVAALSLPHTREFALLRGGGFMICPGLIKPHPFHVLWDCHGSDSTLGEFRNLRHWYWSLGDYDIL